MSKKNTEIVPLPAAAVAAASEKLGKVFERIVQRTANIQSEMCALPKDCCQLGFYFQEATGREQLEFGHFRQIPGLPAGLSFDFAQHCVALSKKYGVDHEFSTAEANLELKLIFQDLKLIEGPQRHAAGGKPLLTNWGSWIFKTFAPINTELKKLVGEQPPEEWPQDRKDNFIAQTQFVAETRRRIGAP